MSKDWESIPEDLAHTKSFVAGGIRWVRESAMYQAMEDVADGFGKEALTAALAEAKEAKDSKWCWRIGNALGIVNPSIESAELAITNLWDEIKKLKMERVLGVEVPSPDVKSPEALRFAADALDTLGAIRSAWSPYKLRQLADEREREQAVETAQDHAIEQAAQVILEFENSRFDHAAGKIPDLSPMEYAQALAGAGLLNVNPCEHASGGS